MPERTVMFSERFSVGQLTRATALGPKHILANVGAH